MESLTVIETEAPALELREAAEGAARTADIRLWSWTQTGGGPYGPELIAKGATVLAEPVVLTLGHGDTIVGTMARFEERSDGAYGIFEFEDTPEGESAYKLAKKRVHRFVSPAFEALHHRVVKASGTAVKVYDSIRLRAVGLTWKPAYGAAQIMEVREQDLAMDDDTKDTPAQTPPAPATSDAANGFDRMAADLAGIVKSAVTPLADKIAALEDAARKGFSVPDGTDAPSARSVVEVWLPNAIRFLSGEKIPAVEMRALADITTTDNLGLVPEGARAPIEDQIDKSRPFMESTREVAEPEGLKLIYPRIVTRPVVGTQSAEKAEVASGPVSVEADDYGAITIAGAADISIQLLRKSSPSFLALFLDLLGEAYAIDADNKALDNLIAAGVTAGTGTFDPEAPLYGEAFANGLAAGAGLTPDHIWLSPTAVAQMIDARTAVGTGITNADGQIVAGLGLNLRPVMVPAMEDEALDVLIGPSRGFAWAESPEMELQADVPGKLGRDVALARMVWFAALHPEAFTSYALAA